MQNVHSPLNFDSVNVHGRAVNVDQEKSEKSTHFNTLRLEGFMLWGSWGQNNSQIAVLEGPKDYCQIW